MGARLLIAAGEAASGSDALPVGVRMLIDAADEIMVVAPRLPGRLDWLSSDTDAATERADERLEAVLGHLGELGADASGRVGADEPLLAFEDAIGSSRPTIFWSRFAAGIAPAGRSGGYWTRSSSASRFRSPCSSSRPARRATPLISAAKWAVDASPGGAGGSDRTSTTAQGYADQARAAGLRSRPSDHGRSALRSAPHMAHSSAPSGTRSAHKGQRSGSASNFGLRRNNPISLLSGAGQRSFRRARRFSMDKRPHSRCHVGARMAYPGLSGAVLRHGRSNLSAGGGQLVRLFERSRASIAKLA